MPRSTCQLPKGHLNSYHPSLAATICFGLIVFGITRRLAVRQVTHHNLAVVKLVGEEFATNAPAGSRADIFKFETKLYRRLALSSIRVNWENTCTLALGSGVMLAISASIEHFRRRS